jgi:hypothetical protein
MISSEKKKLVIVEHHYRVDIFTVTIDQQLQELNNRFNEQAIELFMLSATLDPKNTYTLFSVEDICRLVDKIYHEDSSY